MSQEHSTFLGRGRVTGHVTTSPRDFKTLRGVLGDFPVLLWKEVSEVLKDTPGLRDVPSGRRSSS